MDVWFSMYGSVSSITVTFAKSLFDDHEIEIIRNAIEVNSFFKVKGSGSQFFNTPNSSQQQRYTYVEYEIFNGFLDVAENRDALRDVYHGRKSTFK